MEEARAKASEEDAKRQKRKEELERRKAEEERKQAEEMQREVKKMKEKRKSSSVRAYGLCASLSNATRTHRHHGMSTQPILISLLLSPIYFLCLRLFVVCADGRSASQGGRGRGALAQA